MGASRPQQLDDGIIYSKRDEWIQDEIPHQFDLNILGQRASHTYPYKQYQSTRPNKL